MNKLFFRLSLLMLVVGVTFVSCNKDENTNLVEKEIKISEESNSITKTGLQEFELYSSNGDEVNKGFLLYKNYMDKNMGSNPALVFPHYNMSLYNNEFVAEENLINSIGFDNYVQNLIISGELSQNSGDLILAVYSNPDILLSRDFSDFPSPNYETDQLYDFLYKVALDMEVRALMFSSTDSGQRSGCGWTHFVHTVWEGVTIGIKIGKLIDDALDPDSDLVKGITFPLKTVGAITGGVLGIVVGIIDWEACDCGDLFELRVLPSSSCDGNGTLLAVGETGEIDSYVWGININGVVSTATTSSPTLPVRQVSPDFPINATVVGVCENGEAGTPVSGVVNLFDGDVGDIILNYNCPEEEDEPFFGCFTTIHQSSFTWTSTNQASGNIVYSYTLTGGNVVYSSTNQIRVNWTTEGIYMLTITATNTCSGKSVTIELEIEVFI